MTTQLESRSAYPPQGAPERDGGRVDNDLATATTPYDRDFRARERYKNRYGHPAHPSLGMLYERMSEIDSRRQQERDLRAEETDARARSLRANLGATYSDGSGIAAHNRDQSLSLRDAVEAYGRTPSGQKLTSDQRLKLVTALDTYESPERRAAVFARLGLSDDQVTRIETLKKYGLHDSAVRAAAGMLRLDKPADLHEAVRSFVLEGPGKDLPRMQQERMLRGIAELVRGDANLTMWSDPQVPRQGTLWNQEEGEVANEDALHAIETFRKKGMYDAAVKVAAGMLDMNSPTPQVFGLDSSGKAMKRLEKLCALAEVEFRNKDLSALKKEFRDALYKKELKRQEELTPYERARQDSSRLGYYRNPPRSPERIAREVVSKKVALLEKEYGLAEQKKSVLHDTRAAKVLNSLSPKEQLVLREERFAEIMGDLPNQGGNDIEEQRVPTTDLVARVETAAEELQKIFSTNPPTAGQLQQAELIMNQVREGWSTSSIHCSPELKQNLLAIGNQFRQHHALQNSQPDTSRIAKSGSSYSTAA